MNIPKVKVNDIYVDHIKRNKIWIDKARDLYNIQLTIKAYKKKEKELSGELKVVSDNCSSFGGTFLYSRIDRLGSIDYKSIPELQSIDLEDFRKQSTIMWKLKKI